MSKPDLSYISVLSRLERNLIDVVALVSALAWMGMMIGLGWLASEFVLLRTLHRAFVAAIIVYALVYIGLSIAVRVAQNLVEAAEKVQDELQSKNAAESSEEKMQ